MGDKRNNAGIIDAKLKKQKGDIDSKLYRDIHIVCSLLSRQVRLEILTID